MLILENIVFFSISFNLFYTFSELLICLFVYLFINSFNYKLILSQSKESWIVSLYDTNKNHILLILGG